MSINDHKLIECPIDQINNEDLIATIMELPTWYPINYVKYGVYDRIFENFKKNSKIIDFPLKFYVIIGLCMITKIIYLKK